jgi:hypothetical protein
MARPVSNIRNLLEVASSGAKTQEMTGCSGCTQRLRYASLGSPIGLGRNGIRSGGPVLRGRGEGPTPPDAVHLRAKCNCFAANFAANVLAAGSWARKRGMTSHIRCLASASENVVRWRSVTSGGPLTPASPCEPCLAQLPTRLPRSLELSGPAVWSTRGCPPWQFPPKPWAAVGTMCCKCRVGRWRQPEAHRSGTQ